MGRVLMGPDDMNITFPLAADLDTRITLLGAVLFMRYSTSYYSYGTSWRAPAILISELELRGKGGGEKHVLDAP